MPIYIYIGLVVNHVDFIFIYAHEQVTFFYFTCDLQAIYLHAREQVTFFYFTCDLQAIYLHAREQESEITGTAPIRLPSIGPCTVVVIYVS